MSGRYIFPMDWVVVVVVVVVQAQNVSTGYGSCVGGGDGKC